MSGDVRVMRRFRIASAPALAACRRKPAIGLWNAACLRPCTTPVPSDDWHRAALTPEPDMNPKRSFRNLPQVQP